jgi:hypothetical protein
VDRAIPPKYFGGLKNYTTAYVVCAFAALIKNINGEFNSLKSVLHGISNYVLDFKLTPCSVCRVYPFGLFSGVWCLIADVSEHCVYSIFIGEWMRNV